MHPSKRKGDSAEREAARLIHDLLGFEVRRELGAGRLDDMGDLRGVPNTVIQVVNSKDYSLGVVHKPVAAEAQRLNAKASFAATFMRLRGGSFRVILTPDQWATLVRESLQIDWHGSRRINLSTPPQQDDAQMPPMQQ